MLVLFETAAGYAIFKLLDNQKLKQSDLYKDFETPQAANRILKLHHFQRFADTTEALAAGKDLVDGKLSKLLKRTLRRCCQEPQEQLLVADSRLGRAISEKLHLSCISNTSVQELMRCMRNQLNSLLGNISDRDMTAMRLGLAHSLSRYKIKFSSDKIDTMVIQAICVLDDLDKQINNYIMRAREWFGWHFPEMGKILKDNLQYIRTMQTIGMRENVVNCDLSAFLSDNEISDVREAAETSMGSEITERDAEHMKILCVEILELDRYRSNLKEYLTRRMMVLAPNLTILVGDIVGARLISKAGSLRNLAKHPASTLQILGAEKALFRALKARKNTPKYGLIYHSQLVASTSTKNKGKASRMLAAKAALATRFDALGEESSTSHALGMEHRHYLEKQLSKLDKGRNTRLSGTSKARAKFEKYHTKQEYKQYSASVDSTLPKTSESTTSDVKKSVEERTEEKTPKKKEKYSAPDAGESSGVQVEVKEEAGVSVFKKKKKRSISERESDAGESSGTQVEVKEEADVSVFKKKKKKSTSERASDAGESSGAQVEVKEEADVSVSKKKKKKSISERASDAGESSGAQVEVKEEADVSVSKKKKKKSISERASDAGESSGAQVEVKEEADVSVSKKKKKKSSSERAPDAGESSGAQKVTQTVESSSIQEKSNDSPRKRKIEDSEPILDLSAKKKKKKKEKYSLDAGEFSGAQEKTEEKIYLSLSSKEKTDTVQETTMEDTDVQQSFSGELKKKKKKKKEKKD